MVGEGTLSRWSLVAPFSPLEAYERAAGVRFADPSNPIVGRRTRASGQPSFNHMAYVTISRDLVDDALTVVASAPDLYAGAVATAWRRFFSPVVAYPPFADNLLAIAPIYRLERATLGRPAAAVASYVAALALAALGWRRGRRRGDRGLEAAALFVLLCLLWVIVAGSLIESGRTTGSGSSSARWCGSLWPEPRPRG